MNGQQWRCNASTSFCKHWSATRALSAPHYRIPFIRRWLNRYGEGMAFGAHVDGRCAD
jgi:hypothetical protein